MNESDPIIVKKRDGTLERFDANKLRNCLATAMRECSCEPRVAEPLARAVAGHLREWVDPSPPTSDYVFRCARTALEQTGLADVAAALGGHRRARAQCRKKTRVAAADGQGAHTTPWRKSAVVVALRSRYATSAPAARFLAGQIERQVFALKYRLLTQKFVDELIRNEASAWGLVDEPLSESIPASAPAAGPRPQQEP